MNKPWMVLKNNQTSVALLIILIISLGMNITQYSNNRDQTTIIEDVTSELFELKPLESLRNLTISNPETRYLGGTRIVSGSSLHFLYDEDTGACYCEDDIAFYVPYDNTTIEMKFYLSPSEGYRQGLYLQKGNAYRNESGILVSGNPKDQYVYFDECGGTHIYNATVWQSPVIWETEARNGEKYSILLERSGWYTLSLWSPVLYSTGSLEKSGSFILRDNNSLPYPSRKESWVEFRIINDEEPVLFILRHK